MLDFDSETRSVGSYAIFLTFEKNYYETRNAYVDLRVRERIFDVNFPSDKFTDEIITIYNGDSLEFNISIQDLSRNIPLEGASVKMEFQGNETTLTSEGGGVYSINFTEYIKLMENDISNTTGASLTISKANFTTQIIDITVVISNKRINVTLSDEFEQRLYTLVSGETLSFTVDILDSYDKTGVRDAEITLIIGGEEYKDVNITDNGDGTYTFSFLSYPQAFFTSQTLDAEIVFSKENYKSETIPITIVINMAEIWPGFPMFYFLMIVISASAVAGGIVAYRYYQQSRIPTFVKRARKMKSEIKDRKMISESVLYPSKEEFIVKILGDRWESLGISLADILGIEVRKAKKLPDSEPKVELETLSETQPSTEEPESQLEEDENKNSKGGVE